IKSPTLGNFVDSIFADDAIALAFLQVPASIKYHHNEMGGLLAHSVEAAETTANQTYASSDERDITVVAALLHDIGKVRTLGNNMATTLLGKMVSHDAMTLEVCAVALRKLDHTWPDAANTLRHIWTCASPGARYGFTPICTLANMVRFADKLSADEYDSRATFKSKQIKDGMAWGDNKYHWRPAPETTINERSDVCLLTNIH
ncbi:MAG: HD domain-containing protein, partial [Methylotenera sp.]